MKTIRPVLFTTALLILGISTAAPVPSARANSTGTPAAAAEPEKPKVKPYPLETCLVSDEKLGEMGKPVVFTYQDQEIKLCCKACRKKFDKEPEKYLQKLAPKPKK